jgi:AraC-like DNA-binding protein
VLPSVPESLESIGRIFNLVNEGGNIGAAASDYREYAPPPALTGHLLCFWTQSITGYGEYPQRVLPDGCVDIVFIDDESPIVVGPWTEHFIARLPAGTRIVGTRFHPGRAPSLLGLPAAELLNQLVPLRDVWRRTFCSSLERVTEQPELSARRSAFEATLLNLLAYAAPNDPIVDGSIDWLAHHPHGRIEKLSQWIGISARHLQRRFSASVGYGPKAFQSILRFQRLLNLAGRSRRRRNLAELAADAGYADQAHMTREILRFSGCQPTLLLQSAQSALQMSDFFKTAVDEACYVA